MCEGNPEFRDSSELVEKVLEILDDLVRRIESSEICSVADDALISELKSRGYSVCAFPPSELGQANADYVAEVMREHGDIAIDNVN